MPPGTDGTRPSIAAHRIHDDSPFWLGRSSSDETAAALARGRPKATVLSDDSPPFPGLAEVNRPQTDAGNPAPVDTDQPVDAQPWHFRHRAAGQARAPNAI